MPVKTHKRRKSSKWRGNWSHGWGAKKKHRGSGHRGGAGEGSRGKRGSAKGTLIENKKEYFGKFGFKKKNATLVQAVTLQYLDERAETLASLGKIEQKNGAFVIDLAALGFTKLISKGAVRKKFRITVAMASPRAVEKVSTAGGEVQITARGAAKEE